MHLFWNRYLSRDINVSISTSRPPEVRNSVMSKMRTRNFGFKVSWRRSEVVSNNELHDQAPRHDAETVPRDGAPKWPRAIDSQLHLFFVVVGSVHYHSTPHYLTVAACGTYLTVAAVAACGVWLCRCHRFVAISRLLGRRRRRYHYTHITTTTTSTTTATATMPYRAE